MFIKVISLFTYHVVINNKLLMGKAAKLKKYYLHVIPIKKEEEFFRI